jgi:hypothetical protein
MVKATDELRKGLENDNHCKRIPQKFGEATKEKRNVDKNSNARGQGKK